jgi:hypothetical protein
MLDVCELDGVPEGDAVPDCEGDTDPDAVAVCEDVGEQTVFRALRLMDP